MIGARALFLLVMACGGIAAPADAPAPAEPVQLDALLALLAARRHDTVSFVEQDFLALVKRPVESFGELIYDAPGRLEKRTEGPRRETLIVAADRVTVSRGRRLRTVDLGRYPQLRPLVESLRATLAGDRQALERLFRIEFAGAAAHWTMRLTPHEPALAAVVAEVQIDGTRDQILRVEMRQLDGDRSLLTLRAHPAR